MGFFGSSKKSSSSSAAQTSQTRNTAGPAYGNPKPQNALQMAKAMAKEKARQKAAALSALEPGALYIILFYRAGNDNDFHWGLYHHISPSVSGWKFHIVGGHGHWMTDHGDGTTTGALASRALLGLVRLTNVGVGSSVLQTVHSIITMEDAHLDRFSGLTCRVYVKRACERLKSSGVLTFVSWDALQAEVFAFGNAHNPELKDGEPPLLRPVIQSSVAR